MKGSLIGVFVGLFALLPNPSRQTTLTEFAYEQTISVYDGTANSMSIASGRISYVLGLTGPCFPVDTACSASLVATHLAARSLQTVECEQGCVVAGGILEDSIQQAFATAGMLSPRGRCHAFDARADGYSRGEGSVGFICTPSLNNAQTSMFTTLEACAI